MEEILTKMAGPPASIDSERAMCNVQRCTLQTGSDPPVNQGHFGMLSIKIKRLNMIISITRSFVLNYDAIARGCSRLHLVLLEICDLLNL